MAHSLYLLLSQLDEAKIHYALSRHRPDTVMVTATVVGSRVEIDVFEDGHIEYSQFEGNEDVISGWDGINRIIDKNRD